MIFLPVFGDWVTALRLSFFVLSNRKQLKGGPEEENCFSGEGLGGSGTQPSKYILLHHFMVFWHRNGLTYFRLMRCCNFPSFAIRNYMSRILYSEFPWSICDTNGHSDCGLGFTFRRRVMLMTAWLLEGISWCGGGGKSWSWEQSVSMDIEDSAAAFEDLARQ